VTPERLRVVENLFHDARALAPAARDEFLTQSCADDADLRREVESLLAQGPPAIIDAPLGDLAAALVLPAAVRLTPGSSIGTYRIDRLLDIGGMGEVYRARDTTLGRDVAIKILPRDFSADPERLARFEREARLLAALNHSHIGAIYGIAESEGVRGLVLELIEGPTLANRIAAGALPVDEAVAIALQIVDALEAAHEKGVVHRDLKPANVKISNDGVVKVIDFGLAKTIDAGADEGRSAPPTPAQTTPGLILGTATYMSPEQARGTTVDKRTDIWAFGCVLYEMLTGSAAFGGETISDTIAAVLGRQPDWSALRAGCPPTLRRLLERCLEKNPKLRLRDISDARFDLDDAHRAAASTATASPDVTSVQPGRNVVSRRARGVALLSAVAAVVMAAALGLRLERSDFLWRNPLEGATFTRLIDFDGAKQSAVISRDGKFFAFLSDRDGVWDAFVGQIGTGDVHNLTNGAVSELRNPAVRTLAFSPDGSMITLWNRALQKSGSGLVDGGWAVPTLGGGLRPYLPGIAELDWSADGSRIVYHPSTAGDPIFITEPGESVGHEIYAARSGVHNHFQIWSPDGAFIYFVHGFPLDEMDVWRIRRTGGDPTRLTFHDARVTYPTLLDARTLLYLATDIDGLGPWIYAMDVERRVPHRISTGVEEYTSLAASADGRRLVATSSHSTARLWCVPLGDRVMHDGDAAPVDLPTARSLSPRLTSGFMVYRMPKAGTDGLWKLVDGKAVELWSGSGGRVMGGAAIAPDGQRIAFVTQKRGSLRLNVMNADGSRARELAEKLDVRGSPAWSPDGRWIAIAAIQGGSQRLMKIPADGGTPLQLTADYALDPIWAPSGAFIVYTGADVGTTFQARAVTVDGKAKPIPNVYLTRGARRMAFRGVDDVLVVLKGTITHKEFWELDIKTGRERQLTELGRDFAIGDFDVSRDGRELVFDRTREESDIEVIDRLPR